MKDWIETQAKDLKVGQIVSDQCQEHPLRSIFTVVEVDLEEGDLWLKPHGMNGYLTASHKKSGEVLTVFSLSNDFYIIPDETN